MKLLKKLILVASLITFFTVNSNTANAAANYTLDSQYKVVLYAGDNATMGFNRNVYMETYSLDSNHGVDIAMYDKGGNLVWEEFGALHYNRTSRYFWCGSNVYKITAKVGVTGFWGGLIPQIAGFNIH